MKRFLAACAVVCASLVPASAEPAVTTYALDNGLKVVLAPDHRVPKVVMNLRYRVGSMNEPAGRSGFAHLFEHLMFSGTPAYPNIDFTHSSLGNNMNAWTTEDGTVYYIEGLASTLPTILAVEADRMANLGGDVDQRELDLQRSVVKNEMRQNVLDQAGASGWEAFWSGLFPKPHPYSRTVIGSIADLDSATLDDVRGFFATYYVPNNAVLVLVGDFTVDDAKALIADTLARVPRGADVARPTTPEPAPARIRVESQDRVPAPTVALGFTGPTADKPDNGPLTIAAELLGNSEYGFLRERLVNAKPLATYSGAYWTGGLLGGRFSVEASAADGVSAEALEKELRTALSDFGNTPIDPADLERARRTILLGDRLGTEPLKDRAEQIAYDADILGDGELALHDDPEIVKATAADVQAAVQKYLKTEDASTYFVTPGPRGGYPKVLIDSSGTPQPFAAKPGAPVTIPAPALREPVLGELPAKQTATLSNGIEVVHYQMPEAPMAYIAAAGEGGWNNAPRGKEGLLELAANMSYRGAGERPYGAFAKAAKDIGANVSYVSGTLNTAVTLSVPPDQFDGAVSLLADAVLKPRFDQAEWNIATAEVLDQLARRESDVAGVAERFGRKALFAQDKNLPDVDWSIASVKAVSLDDAKTAYRKIFRPAGMTFYSVGPQSVDQVKTSLEKAFGSWKDDTEGFTAVTQPGTSFAAGRKVLLVPEPGASQSALYVARPAPGSDEPNRAESLAVVRLLGDDFTSRLNSVIREDKGYSYGVSGSLFSGIGKGAALAIATTVERDNTGAALEEVFKGFDTLKATPPTQDELDRTVTAYRTSIAGMAETSGGLFSTLIGDAGIGITLEQDHARREGVTELKLAPVQGQAAALAALDPSLVVVTGDPEVVLPQLKAIGLADVEVMKRGATPEPSSDTAMRALNLSSPAANDNAVPAGGFSARGGSTETVHGCAGQLDAAGNCGIESHGN